MANSQLFLPFFGLPCFLPRPRKAGVVLKNLKREKAALFHRLLGHSIERSCYCEYFLRNHPYSPVSVIFRPCLL
jgi:hypothetical protein